MSEGIVTELTELLALRRYAPVVNYRPEGRALRHGEHLSKLRGRGMNFSEVRQYHPGDDIRHMEWRATARTGRPYIKVYEEERERPMVMLVDFSPTMFFGTRIALKSVVGARLAALLAWTAVKQGDRAGALLVSADKHQEFMPRARDKGILPMMSAISHMTQQPAPPSYSQNHQFSEALQRLRRVARPGSILVIISDFYDFNEEAERHIHRLRQHNDILVYHVCDPIELDAPPPGQYAISDGQQQGLLNTTITKVQSQYRQFCQEKTDKLQAFFRRNQIQYVQLTAADDLGLLVRQTYPRRKNG